MVPSGTPSLPLPLPRQAGNRHALGSRSSGIQCQVSNQAGSRRPGRGKTGHMRGHPPGGRSASRVAGQRGAPDPLSTWSYRGLHRLPPPQTQPVQGSWLTHAASYLLAGWEELQGLLVPGILATVLRHAYLRPKPLLFLPVT